jgi:hypothetical protein
LDGNKDLVAPLSSRQSHTGAKSGRVYSSRNSGVSINNVCLGNAAQQHGRQRPEQDHFGLIGIVTPSLRAAKRRSNPVFSCGFWIASRSLSSGAHSRDPLARNDGAGDTDLI